jgi:hypothetical protein
LLSLVVGILTLAFLLFNSNGFQNWLTSKVTDYLSAQFKTKISIDHINYYPFNGFSLDNVYWGDQKNDTLFFVDELRFNLGSFNKDEFKLTLNDVILEGAYCKMVTYPDGTFNFDVLSNILDPNDTIIDPNSLPFTLYLNRVALHNSRFRLVDSTSEFETSGFDGLNQDFRNIELLARDFWIVDDSLHFDLKNMECTERSGFKLNHFSSITTISANAMYFDSLEVNTPYSRIANYLHMDYNGWDELADFNQKSVMHATLVDSRVDMRDIIFFAPDLYGINHQFDVNGEGSGTVSNMRLKQMDVKFGKGSSFTGSGNIRGLPDIDEMFLDIKAEKSATNKVDLERLITFDLPNEMNRLGTMKFEGRFTGFYNDFVAFGKFNTALGGGTSDLNMKLGDSITPPSYSGNLALQDFDMGAFTGQSVIGKTSLKASVNGKGFALNDLESNIKTEIGYFEANNYRYQKISLGGDIKHKMFAGRFDMNDENAEVHFDGTIDLNKEIPLYKFKASVDYVDLNKLNFDTSHLVFSTNIDIDFAIKDLDRNEGKITLSKSLFIKNGVDYPIDELTLTSSINGDQKSIELNMDMLSASMKGRFTFDQIPQTAQSLLNRLLPEYMGSAPKAITSPQIFTYSLKLSDSRILSEIFFPDIDIVNADIKGKMNSNTGDFTFDGTIEEFSWKSYTFHQVALSEELSNGKRSDLEISVSSLDQNDTLLVKEMIFKSEIKNSIAKSSFVIPDTTGDFYTSIGANTTFEKGSIHTTFNPTSFTFKDKQFSISDKSDVVYTDLQRKLVLSEVVLTHGDESIAVNGFYEIGNGYNLKADISRISLSLINVFYADLGIKLNGTTNGSITLKGDAKDTYINTYLNVDKLALDNDTIGDFSITSNYDENQKRLISHVRSVSGKLKDLEMGGYIDMSKAPYELNYSVVFSESDLKSFQAFVKEDLTIYYGRISAKCKITGTLKDIRVDGSISIMQVLARVEYLKTVYGFSSKIDFDRNSIVVNPFQLNDINGKQARVEGTIKHESFSNFVFNLKMGEMNGFQLLNTAAGENSLYYGKAFVTGRMSLTGPQGDLTLEATLKSSKGTVFCIPLSDSDDSDGDGLLNYVDKDTTVRTVNVKRNSQLLGFSMNMFVTITPDAQIQLVFDEQQNDKIIGSGKGTLKMELTRQGTFSMFGGVSIEDGEYKFTAVDVFTRKFLLKRGGTITWTGDPLQATMNIEGVYKVRNTSVADIITTATPQEKAEIRQQRVPVECILYLRGKLLNPDISFDLNFPDNKGTLGTTNASALESSLRKLRSEPELMQQQVVSLMLFGRFAPNTGLGQAATNNSGTINSELNNTVSDLISAQASGLISKIIPGFDVSADFQAANASQSQQSRTILTASKKFLNERLELQTSFDVERAGNNNNFTGQYSITPDGNLKLIGYNRTSTTSDPLNYSKNITTQGIGLYYRKEFDKFNEFLWKKNKKVTVPNLPPAN